MVRVRARARARVRARVAHILESLAVW